MANDETMWVEKYRPSTLAAVASNESSVRTLQSFLRSGDIPNLLFYGPPGTGKTSTALALARELNGADAPSMTLELNASDARGIDTIRHQIKTFAENRAIFSGEAKLKLVILDEADAMTSAAQFALRRLVERFSRSTRFALIANHVDKIIPAIQSRCTRFRFGALSAAAVAQRLSEVAAAERAPADPAGVAAVARLAQGDLRAAVNLLQSVHAMAGRVTEEAVYRCAGAPTESEAREVFAALLSDSFNCGLKLVAEFQRRKGVYLAQLLPLLSELAQRAELPAAVLARLVEELADAEQRLCEGGSESVQRAALVAAFALARAAAE